MATTPNYGWVMPDPTDFVTDLPADFEIFGDAVDATVDGIETIANAAIPETLIDAAGDLIYGSAADTAARLAIGTAGQVLAVNTGATAPEWIASSSGGLTLLSTTTLSGGSTTISSIPQNDTHLLIMIDGVQVPAPTARHLSVRPNNAQTFYAGVHGQSGSATAFAQTDNITQTAIASGNQNSKWAYWIYDYTNTGTPANGHKAIAYSGIYVTGPQAFVTGGGGVPTGSAITSIVFTLVSSTFSAGTVRIYGVK